MSDLSGRGLSPEGVAAAKNAVARMESGEFDDQALHEAVQGVSSPPTYSRVHTQTREEFGPGYAYSLAPEPLWECRTCGAVVRDMDLHSRWHS